MTLERSANILIVLTAVLALPLFGLRLYDRVTERRPQPPERYVTGDSLQPIVARDIGAARRAVVLYLNSGCKYCTESMDFYRRLGEWRTQDPRAATIVVVGRESESSLRSYTLAHGLKADKVISVKDGDLKLSSTPSLLLVSREGKIQNIWYGRLSPTDEQAVMDRLKATS
jgi:hypothetical protein